MLGICKDNTESLLFIEKEGNNLGYKPDLLKEEIPSFLRGLVICSKCEGLTRDACGIGSPQTFVCLVCTEGNPHSALRTNREVVGSLIILCPLKSRGCGWEGVISSAETHLDTCEYFHKECHLSCGAVLKRIDMNTHLTQECPNRTVECEFCTESHRADKLTLHLEVCANFPLQCVNECGETIQRQYMKSHIEDVCLNTLFECYYGCCDKVERTHLDTHNNDNRLLHLEMKMHLDFKDLTRELDEIKQENYSLKIELSHKDEELEILMSEFEEFKVSCEKRLENTELKHQEFKKNSNLVESRVKTLETISLIHEEGLNDKADTKNLATLNLRCKELEHLTNFQEKSTFIVNEITGIGLRDFPDKCKLSNANCTSFKIQHQRVFAVAGLIVRFTGTFSIKHACNVKVNVCFLLMNQIQDFIAFRYNSSVIVNHTPTEPEDDNNIRRIQSVLNNSRLTPREFHTYTLIDIPMRDIRAEGVCINDSAILQVYYNVKPNNS